MKKRNARQIAIQTLFQVEMTDCDPHEALTYVLQDKKTNDFLETIISGVLKNKGQIDATIQSALTNWTLDRLSRVDLAILRIAVYELNYLQDAPVAVIINEAVELGKIFGNDENGKFINGVLSQVIK